jgi:hypothetical protein
MPRLGAASPLRSWDLRALPTSVSSAADRRAVTRHLARPTRPGPLADERAELSADPGCSLLCHVVSASHWPNETLKLHSDTPLLALLRDELPGCSIGSPSNEG